MTAFPRSVFSEPELDATRWFASKCGVDSLPSVGQVKDHRNKILEQCGTKPNITEGKLGNIFSVLGLGKVLAHVRLDILIRQPL